MRNYEEGRKYFSGLVKGWPEFIREVYNPFRHHLRKCKFETLSADTFMYDFIQRSVIFRVISEFITTGLYDKITRSSVPCQPSYIGKYRTILYISFLCCSISSDCCLKCSEDVGCRGLFVFCCFFPLVSFMGLLLLLLLLFRPVQRLLKTCKRSDMTVLDYPRRKMI